MDSRETEVRHQARPGHNVSFSALVIYVICNIHFDNGLLPFFLSYYRRKGVNKFVFLSRVESKYYKAADVIVESVNEPYVNGPRDNELLNAARLKYTKEGDYYIAADLDEFYWAPGLTNFNSLIDYWDYIPATFVDRIPYDGIIKPFTKDSLDAQFPLGSSLIKNLCRGCDKKVTMLRHNIPTNSGHHFAEHGKSAPFSIDCHHFKWAGSDFWSFMLNRERMMSDTVRNQFPPFRRHYRDNGSRINTMDQSLNIYQSPTIGV